MIYHHAEYYIFFESIELKQCKAFPRFPIFCQSRFLDQIN